MFGFMLIYLAKPRKKGKCEGLYMNIKKIIYEIARNKLKKELTNNLGEVEETSDKLICHVKKSILK